MQLLVNSSGTSPLVSFDLSARLMRITGTSMMTDAPFFYERLIEWLMENKAQIQPQTKLVLSLYFMNSASVRAIYKFLRAVAEEKLPIQIVIIHQIANDNSDVVELLEEICRLLGLSYNLKEED